MNVNYFKTLWRNALVMLLFCFGLTSVWGQVSITSSEPVLETFNNFNGNSTPANWNIQGTGNRGTTWNGNSQTTGASGGWYGNNNMSFLGASSASNGNATWILKNNSNTTIEGFTLSFVGRMWRSQSNSPTVTVSWQYHASSSTNPSQGALSNTLNSCAFNDSTTDISSGVTLSQTVSSISIPAGAYIFIRFIHSGGSNSDNLGWDDITFTPILAPTTPSYTLTYNAGDNGTITGTSPQTVDEGEDGTAVTAVPNTGYHFVSWSDDSTDNPRTDSDVQEDISVTANFAINTYTVTYDGNGSDGGFAPVDVNNPYDHGSTVTVLGAGDLTKTDNAFLGWSTDEGAVVPQYTEGNEITITSDLELFAVWIDASLEEQTITFDELADKTYGDASFDLTATADSELAVSYESSDENVATIDGNTVTIVGAGTTTITASQAGNENYQPAVPVQQTLTVNPKNLTIAYIIVPDKPYDGTTAAEIDISVASLVETVVEDEISFAIETVTGEFASADVGTDIEITLHYEFVLFGPDAANYTLTQPTLTGNINKADQTLSGFENITKHENEEAFDLPTTTAQGLALTYESSNTAVATVSGNTVTIVGIGTTTITATQEGNNNYNTFENSITLTVTEAPAGPCGEENFENIPFVNGSADSSYSDRTWQSNGNTWTATKATTNQTITGKAILLNFDGVLTSPEFIGGIGSLSFKTKYPFGESANHYLSIRVNGVEKGQVTRDDIASQNTIYNVEINDINISGDVIITIVSIPVSGSGNRARFAIDDLVWTCYASTDPLLTVTETELTGFNYVAGSGPSASQDFVVSGVNLDGSAIVVTAPANFEVSTDDVAFDSSLNLSSIEGTLAATTVYVRLAAGLTAATYSGNITISGGTAEEVTVAVSGEVTPVCDEGTLIAGTTIASTTEVTSGGSVNLSLTGTSTGAGLTYQWQSSSDNENWTDIEGAESITHSPTVNAATYYRCAVTCGETTVESASVLVSIAYCTAGATDTDYEKISNFTFADINNNSSNTAGYEDFTAVNTNVTTGIAIPFSVSMSQVYSSDQILIWVDLNQDSDFDDDGELIFTGAISNANPVTGNITIPNTATLGNTRLRIRLHDTNNTPNDTPCGNSEYGQVEDYTVNIVAASPTLIANPVSLSDFTYPEGFGPSEVQPFTLSGNSLDGSDVTLLAGEGYEISTNEEEDFSDMLELADFDGMPTIVYVRMVADLAEGTYNDIILVSGGDAEDIEVPLSGSVTAAPVVPVVTEENLQATVGIEFSYEFIATENPTAYNFTSGQLPVGVVFNSTGEFYGTPVQAGEFTFGITATNIAGESEEAVFTMDIAKGTQVLADFTDLTKIISDADFDLTETTNAEFTVIYLSSDTDVATIDGNTVTIVGLGTTTITASAIDEDENWEDFSGSIVLEVVDGPCLEEGFTGWSHSYGDWTHETSDGTWAAFSTFAGSNRIQMNDVGDWLELPLLNYPASIEYQGAISSAAQATPDNIKIQYFNGTSWIDVAEHTATSTSNETFSASFPSVVQNSSNVRVRLYRSSDNRTHYIDDIKVFCSTPPVAITWTTENEWSNLTGPTIDDDVVIQGDNYVVVGNVAAKTLTVANSGKITIPENAALTVEGKITNNGEFIINHEGLLYQNNFTGANEGDITVERDAKPMRRLDYTLWSSPVSGMLLNQFSNISNNGGTGTIWNRVYELGATAWESVWDSYANATASTETFATAKGYLYRAFNSYDPTETTIFTGEFTGVPNNGDYSINTPNMFDAIGNPYPSPVFADDFFNANVGAGAIYFWTNVNPSNGVEYIHNNWASYTIAGGVGVQAEGVGEEIEVPNGWIHPGVGFVVYTEESTASVVLNNGMRINTNGALGREMATERSRFWLNLSNEEVVFNQILVGYMDNATQGVDTGIDGKMFAYEGNALYSIIENSEDNFVIQGRSLPFTDSDVVALGFRAVNAGSFTISLANLDGLFAEGNTTIYLKDNFTQTQHNLNSGAYSFVSEEGMFDNRFEVVYQTTMSVENPIANNANWVVYNQGEGYQIQTQGFELQNVTVFDLLGRTIYTAKAEGTGHNIPALGADSVYIVKVTTTDNVVLSKKVK